MTRKKVRVYEGLCLFMIRLIYNSRLGMELLNLILLTLFTQPLAVSVTAAICEDSQASHFRFCLNLVSCLLRNHSSRRLVNTLKLSEERQQTVNPHYIPLKFLAATKDVHSTVTRYK